MDVEYRIADAARHFDLKTATIKKYYGEIEKYGYEFGRNNQGYIMFSENDIQVLQKFIEVKNKPGYTISNAAEEVVRLMQQASNGYNHYDYNNGYNQENMPTSEQPTHSPAALNEELLELKQLVNSQTELINRQNQIIMDQQKQLNRIENNQPTDTVFKNIVNELRTVKDEQRKQGRKKWYEFREVSDKELEERDSHNEYNRHS